MKAWKVHPVDRSENDLSAALWAIRALNREETVGLFPEGRRNPTGMRMAHSGIAYIAARTQTPILPVGITGTENIPGYWRILLAFHKIRVNIGTPFTLPPIDGKLERGVRDSLTEMIMLRVAALLPKEYRGDYGATVNGSVVQTVGGITDPFATTTKMFVRSAAGNIYKCMWNNSGAASTVEPTGTSTSEITTGDSYVWKYMFTHTTTETREVSMLTLGSATLND